MTDNTDLRPGNFPIGSPASRAAARHLLKQRMEGRKRRELIIGIEEGKLPKAFEYDEVKESGEMSRMIAIPYGMTIADGFRVIGGFTEEELAFPELQTVVDCTGIWSFVH